MNASAVWMLVGLLLGGGGGFLLAHLWLRAGSVRRTELDAMRTKAEELASALAVATSASAGLEGQLGKIRDELGVARKEFDASRADCSRLAAELRSADAAGALRQKDFEQLKVELRTSEEARRESATLAAKLTAENNALSEKQATLRKEMEDLRAAFKSEFANIANQLLDDKSKKFTDLNKEQLQTILVPLREHITAFKDRIEQIHSQELKDRSALEKQVQIIAQMNQRICEEANNLTKALKGDSRAQGEWGEILLERILENSGLKEGREYHKQEYLRGDKGEVLVNDAGDRMRPDIIIDMPEEKKVLIDSKVSLLAFLDYSKASMDEERDEALRRHLKSLKAHIDGLSGKNYQSFVKKTLDFVIMFVPNEPAYMLAIQKEETLWQYAYDKRILLVSPTNLFAMLKIISELWRKEYQMKHMLEIADRGAKLYEKFVGFVDDMGEIDRHLNGARKAYTEAFGKLSTGPGNLVRRTEQLRQLGLKVGKRLPDGVVAGALEGADDEKDGAAPQLPQAVPEA